MKKQKIRSFGASCSDEFINVEIEKENHDGWQIKQISSHGLSNSAESRTVIVILFEKE